MINWGKVDTSKLESEFLRDVTKLLSDSPHQWKVTEGLRSMERSKELNDAFVAGKGPRAAPPGKSAHNYGLAIDVALIDPKNSKVFTWDTTQDGWQWLKVEVDKHPRLHSLHSVGDWPHIEKVQWQQFKNWSKGGGQ